MKFAQHAIAALALFSCLNASASPYPTEYQLRTAIGDVAGMLRSESIEIEILDAQKEGLNQPLMAVGLRLPSGVCLIFYNTEPEEDFNQFFGAIPEKDLPVMLTAMAVHEASHCIEQREAYVRKRFDRVLPPHLERDNMTVQGYLSVVNSGALLTWSEALADIASVLYLKRTEPDRWKDFSNRIAAMRHSLAWKWPAHDTSAWLHQIIAADPGEAAEQNLFATAFRLRRQYLPAK
jgi:phage tail protein X